MVCERFASAYFLVVKAAGFLTIEFFKKNDSVRKKSFDKTNWAYLLEEIIITKIASEKDQKNKKRNISKTYLLYKQ